MLTVLQLCLPVASRKPLVRHCHSLKTFDSVSVDTVSKVESGSGCHYSVTGPNPRYLTTPDLSISTSPDSYPTPMVAFHIGGRLSLLICE